MQQQEQQEAQSAHAAAAAVPPVERDFRQLTPARPAPARAQPASSLTAFGHYQARPLAGTCDIIAGLAQGQAQCQPALEHQKAMNNIWDLSTQTAMTVRRLPLVGKLCKFQISQCKHLLYFSARRATAKASS